MAGSAKGSMSGRLRKLASLGPIGALRQFGEVRASTPESAFRSLYQSAKTAAARHRLFRQTPAAYKDLAFCGPLAPISLGAELKFAAIVLADEVTFLNEHTVQIASIQQSQVRGDYDAVKAKIEQHIRRFGWSYWAADLLFANTHDQKGGQEARRLTADWQRDAPNRPSSLYATMLIDRNDESYTFSSFTAKCERSFPRFQPDWFRTYIAYRSLGSAQDPMNDYPVILATEISSSLIDYYECIIGCILDIYENAALSDLVPAAKNLLSTILSSGSTDWRVPKLLLAFDPNFACVELWGGNIDAEVDLLDEMILRGQESTVPAETVISAKLIETLQKVEELGAAAIDENESLVKTGVNYKSLPIAAGLAFKTIGQSSDRRSQALFNLVLTIATPKRRPEHYLAYRDEVVISRVRTDLTEGRWGEFDRKVFAWVVQVLDGSAIESGAVPRSLFAEWLAKYLIVQRRYEDAVAVCDQLSGFGAAWNRRATKIKIVACRAQGEVASAFRQIAELLATDYRFAYELPLQTVLRDISWADVRDMDPVLVGLVANYANVIEPGGGARFICRMACRKFFHSGAREKLDEAWRGYGSDVDRSLLLAFLEDAWTEDNLALVESFRSTHDVRREQMEIFQHLLSWNPAGEKEYSSYIKQLTLDETLWRGLQHIDERRVFVNEAGVSRWAEKEILSSFERWRAINLSGESKALQDELLRNYLIDPSIENLVSALPEGSATEANTLLLELVGQVFSRFMTDPTDGLESYLSLRIRHGTLRGTILGPLEQDDLLILGDLSEEAFHKRWGPVLGISADLTEHVVGVLRDMSKRLQEQVRVLVEEKVQVLSAAKSSAAFPSRIDPTSARLLLPLFSGDMSFPAFLASCYLFFWALLRPYREELARHISEDVKAELQRAFEGAIPSLQDAQLTSLIGALRASSTQTQNQCDVVAAWFTRESDSHGQAYPLNAAIEIAKRATQNVYRQFPAELQVDEGNAGSINLSANGLTVLYDVLYVAFANAWKHSGLGENLGAVDLSVEFDKSARLLKVVVENDLSLQRAQEMRGEKTDELKAKYLKTLPIDLVAREGGSGFPKLARAVQMVDRSLCPVPLDFGVIGQRWRVSVYIPLYERNGRFDAYE